MDQEVVMLEEVQLADLGHMLACGDRDIFDEVSYTISQLLADLNVLTQEDPRVPATSEKLRKLCNLYTICAGLWSLNKTTPRTHHRRVGRGTRGTQSLSFIC